MQTAVEKPSLERTPLLTDGKDIHVSNLSFIELFEKSKPFKICIPEYQRPYVWDEDKVEDLLNDLDEFFFENAEPKVLKHKYYFGTVLLHQKQEDGKKELHIIDGQQRISTLLVLYYVIYGRSEFASILEGAGLTYDSPHSKYYLKKSQKVILNSHITEKLKKIANLHSLFDFTVITTSSEDDAFTFFEASNNRGVTLASTDYLKAYHLRGIGGTNKDWEDLQRSCAKRWEKVETRTSSLNRQKNYAENLFESLLWRSRVWRGTQKDVIQYADQTKIRNEFEKRTLKPEESDKVRLYPSLKNQLASRLVLSANGSYELECQNIKFQGDSFDFPFSLRQPISEGLNFFLYAEKYADLAIFLFEAKEHTDEELQLVLNLYQQVYRKISVYLQEMFILAIAMYYDKFGSNKISVFANCLDMALGSMRLSKKYIFNQAPLKFLRDDEYRGNLLDVIDQSYRPQEVIDFLKTNYHYKTIYSAGFEISGNGVQAKYLHYLSEFFNTTEPIEKRISWNMPKK